MIQITVNERLEYSVIYRLEGLKATEVLSNDRTVILRELDDKLRLEMGLAKGKVFTQGFRGETVL